MYLRKGSARQRQVRQVIHVLLVSIMQETILQQQEACFTSLPLDTSKYCGCRLLCLPFVWHVLFDWHIRTHGHKHTHTHTHTHKGTGLGGEGRVGIGNWMAKRAGKLSCSVISADFIIMFLYQCSSIIVVRMMLCITPRLFLILHVASPLDSIIFSSIYFPVIVISSLAFNCIKSVLDNRFPMSHAEVHLATDVFETKQHIFM